MLLPIGERSVIGVILGALEREDRIDDVYVSTNEAFAETFETYLEESDYEKPQLSIEDTTAESEKFGVVGALAQLVDREGLTDDTLVIAGDNLISFDIGDFLDTFQANGDPTLAAYDVGSYERATEYGLLELNDDDEVVDFQEKPDDPTSTLVSIACYGFTGETLPKLHEYLEGGHNPDEPGWFIKWLQRRETVHAFSFDEAWFDIGTPDSYLDAVAWYLDGENFIHPDATTETADLGENVQILADATVTDATITDSVVFPEATIKDGEIRRSLIDTDTYVEGLDLSGAVIGAHTTLNGSS
jgi:glucose-1-phosphate thymidylyltransferase